MRVFQIGRPSAGVSPAASGSLRLMQAVASVGP